MLTANPSSFQIPSLFEAITRYTIQRVLMRTLLTVLLAAAAGPLWAQQSGQLVNTKCPVRPASNAKRGFVVYFNGHFIGFC